MKTTNKLKIFNDPIYGFITIPNTLIFDLIQHPYFQRLRRISQMGMSYMVYPGAHHTRFHHALGCMHLMQKAVATLRFKGTIISDDEENALYIAILLHDMGHGPFSHAMERSIVEEVHHEELSLLFMQKLNEQFKGALSMAIDVFTGKYPRKFMHQLISSQLDMDRMDYLRRDSFYSGVEEGKINSERLIQMMQVKDDLLVIEEKGIFSVEKFLVARRLMYWQTYLHKTGVLADELLSKILKRAKDLFQMGISIEVSQSLRFFIENKVSLTDFNSETLNHFAQLDDVDVMSLIKSGQFHSDFVLSALCKMIINRDLPKIAVLDEKIKKEELENLKLKTCQLHAISKEDAAYFVFKGKLKNQAYNKLSEPIHILKKSGEIVDILEMEDQKHLKLLAKPITKHFICYPKVLI